MVVVVVGVGVGVVVMEVRMAVHVREKHARVTELHRKGLPERV